MRSLHYVVDQHILTAGEIAATHVSKWWTPQSPFVQVLTAGAPVTNLQPIEWLLYQIQVAVASTTGYARQGHQVKLLTNGAPGHGGIHLLQHQQNAISIFSDGSGIPTGYGFGWGIWPGGTLVAGDVVQMNAVYRVVE